MKEKEGKKTSDVITATRPSARPQAVVLANAGRIAQQRETGEAAYTDQDRKEKITVITLLIEFFFFFGSTHLRGNFAKIFSSNVNWLWRIVEKVASYLYFKLILLTCIPLAVPGCKWERAKNKSYE